MTHKLPPAIYAIQFVVLMSFSSLAVLNLLPLYLQHLGGSPRQIGLFLGLFSFAAFAARPFGAWLLGRIEPRKILVLGLYVQLVMTGLYLTMGRLNVYAGFIRVFHGFGMSLFILAALLLTINLTEREQRTHALGVVSAGFLIPLLVLPFIGESIIARFGFQPFFRLAVVLALIPAVFALFVKFPSVSLEEKEPVSVPGLVGLLFRRRILALVGLALLFE
ncbi:MAG: MFS transporter, partial [Candidatus Aminicenantes bacterium]|nr:MFS transporter [Candidatus Aminicenantes bacterium]